MLIDLIATVAAGFAGAGIALILRHLSGGRIHKGLAPIAAGLAMISYLVWNDYNWFDRTSEGLDERLEVVATYPESAVWRPWSYVVPVTERFMAYDTGTVMRNDAAPGQALVNLYLYARRTPPAAMPLVIDCELMRRGNLYNDVQFAEDGSLDGVTWHDMAADDPLIEPICDPA